MKARASSSTAEDRGRSRARRILRPFMLSLAVLGALMVLLHLPPVQRFAGDLLSRTLNRTTPFQVTLGRLGYRLWAGEVSIEGLALRRDSLTITCPRARVRLGPSGVHVLIADVGVSVRQPTPNRVRKPGPYRPWEVLRRFATIVVERGAFEMRDENGHVWLRLNGIETRVETTEGTVRGIVQVASANVGWPGAGVRASDTRVSARFEIDSRSGVLRVLDGRVAKAQSDIHAAGNLGQLRPVIGDLQVRGKIDAQILREIAPESQADGALEVRVSVKHRPEGATGTAELETAGLTIARVGPWSARMRARIEGRRLLLDALDANAYGATFSATGAASLGQGISALDVRVRAPDVAAIAAAFEARRPPIAARADLNLRLQLENWQLDTLSGAGGTRLEPRPGRGLPISGRADVTLSRRQLTFVAPALSIRQARIDAGGSIAFPASLSADYQIHIPDLAVARSLLDDVGLTTPELEVTGAVDVAGALTGRLPDWESHGRVRAMGLSLEGIDLDLEAELSLTRRGMRLDSLTRQGPDGHVVAKGFVPFRTGDWAVDVEAANVQLAPFLLRRGLPLRTRVGGTLRIDGPAARPRGRFSLDGTIAANGARQENAGAPAGAVVHAAGAVSREGLVVEKGRADLGGGRIEASGTWNRIQRSLDGHVSADRIALETLPWLPVARHGITSTFSADLSISGPVRAPIGRASFALKANTFRAAELPDLILEATSDGQEASLRGTLGSQPFLTGRLPLVQPWPLHLDLELAKLPVTEVLSTLPRVRGTDATVAIDGRLSLDIPVFSPRDVRYEADVTRVEARLRHVWRADRFTGAGDAHGVHIQQLTLMRDGGGHVTVDGYARFSDSPPGSSLTLRSDIPLSSVAFLLPDAELDGHAGCDLRIGGSLDDPVLEGSVKLAAGPGRVGRVRWGKARADGLVRNGVLTVDSAQVDLMGGAISVTGSVPIRAPADGPAKEIRVEARAIDIGTLLDSGQPRTSEGTSPPPSVLVDFSARFSVPRPAIDAIEGEGQLTRFTTSAMAPALGLEAPVTWQLKNGVLNHSTIGLRGGATALDIATDLRVSGGKPQGRVTIKGQLDTAAAQPFLPAGSTVEGIAHLDLQIDGGPAGLMASGGARLDAGRVLLREPPLALNNVTGRLKANGRRVELTEMKASVGDGELSATGTMTIPESAQPEIEMHLDFARVPLSYPQGLRSRTSGKIRLVGAAGRYRVEGDAVVHRAVFTRETDRTTVSLERVNLELSAIEARGSPLQKVDLAVRVRLEDGLRIESDRSQLVVDGAVTVGGDLLTPEIRGSLVLREGGTVRLSRASLRIAQGRVELAGFPARPPDVSIQGRTQVTGVLIEVNVTGPLDDFSLSLSAPSRPDLTQGDLASLILTGRTASAAVSEGGTIVAEQLAATLGEAVESGLGGAVFIDIARDEDLIVQDTNPSQRLNIGVPVGRRLYVIYSQALDRNAPRWIVELRPAGEVRVRFISDSDGSDALQIAHRFSFNVWSRGGARARISESTSRVREVLLEGSPQQEEADLRRATGLEPGSTFDYFRGEKSARALHDALRDRGYLAAIVEFSDREVAPGRVDVAFKVRPGPRVDIRWLGDDPGGAARRRAEQGWDGSLPLEENAVRLATEMRRLLQSERYYTAGVTATVTGTGERAEAAFDVRRGPRGREVELRFEGNAAVPDHTLSAALPSGRSEAFFFLLEPEGRGRLASAIRLAYAREGFLKAAAGIPQQRFDSATGVLSVTIPIEEGPRAEIVDLVLPESARASADAAPPALKLSVGAPFQISTYLEDRNRLTSWYRERGYTEARVTGILEPREDGLAVRFGVVAGPRVRVGAIRFARGGHTRPSVVRDAVTLAPGDPVRPSELERSTQRLSETGVFRSVDVRTDPASDAATRDLVVDLSPRDDLSVEYSIRYTTNGSGTVGDAPSSGTKDEIQYGAALEASNPFGFAKRYRLYGLVGGERALLGLTFDSASFFGYRWRTQVFLFDDQDRLPDIPRLLGRVQGATFQQTKRWRSESGESRWRDRLRMLWGYTFKQIRYSDPETLQSLSGDRAGFIYSLIGDTRDSVTDPHRGLFWSVGMELALRALGSDVDYVKLFDQVYYYVPLGQHVVWAQGYRVGVTPGTNPLLLLEGRFRAGGASSVRGFEENILGPLTPLGEPIGGQAVLIFNQELRFPLVKRLWGGVFYDAGSAFTLVQDMRLDALRQSAGAGLRFMFPFGPVRFEHAWILDPRDGEARSRWVFSLGHAF